MDAGVLVSVGIDIYGPCRGLAACCGLGAFSQSRTKRQGPT